MIGLSFGIFPIAWLVIDSLDPCMRYRGCDPGDRFKARLSVREVVVGVGRF
jgi:hypothetical protein